LGHLLDEGVDGVFVGDVADIAVGVDAGFLVGRHALVNEFLLDVVEDDGGAAVGHRGRDREADAVGSAGDQRDLAGQIKRFRSANRHCENLLMLYVTDYPNARAGKRRRWRGSKAERRFQRRSVVAMLSMSSNS